MRPCSSRSSGAKPELAATREGQQAARVERIAATRREAAQRAARFERLRALAGNVPALTARLPQTVAAPAENDDAAWDGYLAALESATVELETLLLQTRGIAARDVLEALAPATPAPSIHDALHAYVLERQGKPGLDPAQTERFRETAARILGRLELAPGEAVPEELQTLAREIVLAPSVERAESLATELRLAVQRSSDARERDAAAFVLEQSLRDLGYEVEDIEATLFVDGGTVHFTRAGLGELLRAHARRSARAHRNFNVVRASGDEDTAERRRLDALAEDRWCAEFPRLMQTLAARGHQLDVTRRLEAGEVPVQVVDARALPRVARRGRARGRARRRSARPHAVD